MCVHMCVYVCPYVCACMYVHHVPPKLADKINHPGLFRWTLIPRGVYVCSCVWMCMCAYVYMYVRVCACVCMGVYVCLHVCMCMCSCVYVWVCMCVYVYAYVYSCMCVCAFVWVYVSMCMCMYTFMHMCVCVSVCMCIYVWGRVCVYSFPRAAVTNYNKLGNFKTQENILSSSGDQNCDNSVTGLKSRYQQGRAPCEGSRGGYFLASPRSWWLWCSSGYGRITLFSTSDLTGTPALLSISELLLPPLLQTFVVAFMAHPDNPG